MTDDNDELANPNGCKCELCDWHARATELEAKLQPGIREMFHALYTDVVLRYMETQSDLERLEANIGGVWPSQKRRGEFRHSIRGVAFVVKSVPLQKIERGHVPLTHEEREYCANKCDMLGDIARDVDRDAVATAACRNCAAAIREEP